MFKRKIALFGRSAKRNHYCVAGIDIESGKYIRPISDIPKLEGAVRRIDYVDEDGNEFNDFDVVEITFKDRKPVNPYQPENLVYDENSPWKKLGSLTLNQMIAHYNLDRPREIFYNAGRSVLPAVVESQVNRASLLFTQIQNLFIKVKRWSSDYPKFYADFEYRGISYSDFSVGDIKTRELFWNKSDGLYHYKSNATVVLSLTNPFSYNGSEPKCYKMLAQVF